MTKLARLPTFGRGAEGEPGEADHAPRLRTRYYAFLSYSHKDKDLADWLHRELEKFRVPSSLAGKLTANGVVPRRLTPIFRDEHDLSAGGDLALEIEAALAASQFLVVLCSPTAARSHWTNLEIESFKRTRPEGCVLAAVAAGEPFASEIPGREDEECFPPALRYKYDRRGHRTSKRADPLAADFRDGGDTNRTAFLKLVAGMLGVGLDELVQRETVRRQRRLAYVAAASLAGMAITSTLAITAIQARDAAREQRREAEGLVAFMLGDLKDKLEPIGRLDALDGVGSRVLAYYQNEGTSELSDAALTQRSKALSLMAEVANARGDFDTAARLYREAMAGSAEAIQRKPNDPQLIWEHAQNVFYFGQMKHYLGDLRTAEAAMREYKRLALQMVALGPDNMKWRMEEQYADVNLGVVLNDQRRFKDAAAQFSDSLKMIEAISTADPGNKDYRESIAESLAWIGDADHAVGDYQAAIVATQRDIALLEQLAAETRDVNYRQRLIPAHRNLGNLYAEQGESDLGLAEYRAAVAQAEALTAIEPNNAQWQLDGYNARDSLARHLLLAGQTEEAASQADSMCQSVRKLLTRDPKSSIWRIGEAACLALQARVELARGSAHQALGPAKAALAIAKTSSSIDAAGDAFRIAAYGLLIGNIYQKLGNSAAAQDAWASAYQALPPNVPEMPFEMALHAIILQRLGRTADAQPLLKHLNSIGYRAPTS